ncbi:hypothetical protein F5Y08DRAFT_338683 [Xylaria arbuscula]|nr:hypothetical protein F5Y08DRAFT_338683 [Xylaria arbuscula]
MRGQPEQIMSQMEGVDHAMFFRADEYDTWWQQARMQLDPFSNCRSIKITGMIYHALGDRGREYFIYQASLILNGQAEFFEDAMCQGRYWLSIGEELVNNFGFTITRALGMLPILSHREYQSLLLNTPFNYQPELEGPKGDPSPEAEVQPPAQELLPIQSQQFPIDAPVQASQFPLDPQFGKYEPQLPINPLAVANQYQLPLIPLDEPYDFSFAAPVGAPQYPPLSLSPQSVTEGIANLEIANQGIANRSIANQSIANQQHNNDDEAAAVPQAPDIPANDEELEQPARGRKRKASGGDPGRVKRPMNCFLHYRVAFNEELRKTNPVLTFVGTSKEFSNLWNNLPPAERLMYKQRADEEAAEHKRLHPNYRYTARPKRKGNGNGRGKKAAAAKAKKD